MPIPVAQLQERARPWPDRILEFLRRNPTQAYSAAEIYGGIQGLSESALAMFVMLLLAGKKPDGPLAEVKSTLEELERQGHVQSARHMNTTYYAIR